MLSTAASLSQGSDWILPSSTLILKKINALDAGLYTCLAEHPLFPSLSKSLSIKVNVFGRKAPNVLPEVVAFVCGLCFFGGKPGLHKKQNNAFLIFFRQASQQRTQRSGDCALVIVDIL